MAGKKGQKIVKEKSKRSWEYYQKLYPEYSQEQCEELAKKYRKQCNYNCIEYWQTKYPEKTLEECKELKKKAQFESRKNNKTKIEYYQYHYPEWTKEQQTEAWHNYAKTASNQCIEFYQKRFPDLSPEEQEALRIKAVKNYTEKRIQSGERNGMHHSRTTPEQRRSISPRCIEFYQRKYPELSREEQEEKLKEFFEKNRKRIKNAVKPTNIEYYLNQGMSKEEAKIALHNRQSTFTLEKCIKKYGEEEGIKKFQERQEKWIKSLKDHFIKESNNHNSVYFESTFQNKIVSQIICNGLQIETEYYLFDKKSNRGFSYDIRYKNKIIEIQGDYWHANPKFYTANDKIRNNIAKDIWKHDRIKYKAAKRSGYEILYIWESDYNNDPEKQINKCLKFLNDN